MLTAEQIARIISSAVKTDDTRVEAEISNAAQKIYDLCKPDHSIHVAAAALENEVTSTLMDMLAATILATLIDDEGGGRTNVRFSPGSMQEKLAAWDYTVVHEGLERNVRVTPKDTAAWQDGEPPSKLSSLLHTEQEDVSGAKPQAEPKTYDRPVWAVRYVDGNGELQILKCRDRADAERSCRTLAEKMFPKVENRHCLHPSCPTSICNVWKDSDETPGNGMNPDGN